MASTLLSSHDCQSLVRKIRSLPKVEGRALRIRQPKKGIDLDLFMWTIMEALQVPYSIPTTALSHPHYTPCRFVYLQVIYFIYFSLHYRRGMDRSQPHLNLPRLTTTTRNL